MVKKNIQRPTSWADAKERDVSSVAMGSYSGSMHCYTLRDVIRRSRIRLLTVFCLWTVLFVVGLFLFSGGNHKETARLISEGVSVVSETGSRIISPLLEDNILAIAMELKAFKKLSPVFVAVLNHAEMVVVHSDPGITGRPLEPLGKIRKLQVNEDVSVEKGTWDKGVPVVQFSKTLLFSGVKIGMLVVALDASRFELSRTSGMMSYTVIGAALLIVSLGGLVLFELYSMKKIPPSRIEAGDCSRVIGAYRLKERIAEGGMSELYLAEYIRDDGFKRIVAIKMILPHLGRNEEFIRMFVREARLAALLQHPNIVQIYDLIRQPDANCISMEYVHGRNLAEIMSYEKKGLPLDAAVFIIQKICLGLHYSHTKTDEATGIPLNIVHRDITPQNMLISFRGEVKISDFGISKAKSEPSFTKAGSIKGKLSYLSPEQALGREVSHQADIYALGIVFYEVLTGRRLYRFDNEVDAIRNIPTMIIPPVMELRPDIPAELNAIVEQCLEKDLALRYQTAKQLHNDLGDLKVRFGLVFDDSDLSDFMKQRFDPNDMRLKN